MSWGWIGVDLDGTLAQDTADVMRGEIGPPVPAMVERVKAWRGEGWEVRLFTARAPTPEIRAWCLEHLGEELPITCEKDYGMVQLWDDRAIQVVKNTGERVGSVER